MIWGYPYFWKHPYGRDGTVDGNQKSGYHSPVEGTVVYLIITMGFDLINVVGNGISEPSTVGMVDSGGIVFFFVMEPIGV